MPRKDPDPMQSINFTVAPRRLATGVLTRRAALFVGLGVAVGAVVGGACGYAAGVASAEKDPRSDLPPTSDPDLLFLRELADEATPVEELVRNRLRFLGDAGKFVSDSGVVHGLGRLVDATIDGAIGPEQRKFAKVR